MITEEIMTRMWEDKSDARRYLSVEKGDEILTTVCVPGLGRWPQLEQIRARIAVMNLVRADPDTDFGSLLEQYNKEMTRAYR